MSGHFFILPHADAGDTVPTIQVGGGEVVLHVSADELVKIIAERDQWRQTARAGSEALRLERERVRRLMRAIADEVVGTPTGGGGT
ncbi:MAG TPA: hypothetical protein VF796_02890 [Humisphaera sp.]